MSEDMQKLVDLATLDVERLEKELDITNADHIALWLASSGRVSISYLAVQIAQAYDRAIAVETAELQKAVGVADKALSNALFVIRKQGVMPNSSWENGFLSDQKVIKEALKKRSFE